MLKMATTRITVERERERESCNLRETAFLACANKEISLLTGKLYIIYCKLKINLLKVRNQRSEVRYLKSEFCKLVFFDV